MRKVCCSNILYIGLNLLEEYVERLEIRKGADNGDRVWWIVSPADEKKKDYELN